MSNSPKDREKAGDYCSPGTKHASSRPQLLCCLTSSRGSCASVPLVSADKV